MATQSKGSCHTQDNNHVDKYTLTVPPQKYIILYLKIKKPVATQLKGSCQAYNNVDKCPLTMSPQTYIILKKFKNLWPHSKRARVKLIIYHHVDKCLLTLSSQKYIILNNLKNL